MCKQLRSRVILEVLTDWVVANLALRLRANNHVVLGFKLNKLTRGLISTGSAHVSLYLELIKDLLLVCRWKIKVSLDLSFVVFIVWESFDHLVIVRKHFIVFLQEQHCLLLLVWFNEFLKQHVEAGDIIMPFISLFNYSSAELGILQLIYRSFDSLDVIYLLYEKDSSFFIQIISWKHCDDHAVIVSLFCSF